LLHGRVSVGLQRSGGRFRELVRRLRILALLCLGAAVGLFALVNLLALATPPVPVAPSRLPRLIIHDVPDGGGRTTTAQTVVIEHDRIVYAGPADAVAASLPGTRIDGGGKFLVPGLWEAHVHTLRLAPQLQLPLLIANGVTSVRNLGDTCAWSSNLSCVSPAAAWQLAISNGAMVGPRLQQVVTYSLEEPQTDGAELRSLLLTLKARGESMIKLRRRQGVGSRGARPASLQPSMKDLPDQGVGAGGPSRTHARWIKPPRI